jgi:tetratricopeptide repeat protein
VRHVLAVGVAALCGALSLSAAQAAPAPRTTPAPASEAEPAKNKKETPPPFYRKYLVPGDKLDDQIAEQEKRVAESPDDANLRNDFGNLLARRHFPKEAAEQYEMAAKLDKNNFIAYYNLGLLRETEGKVGDAIAAYRKSIKRKPGFPPSRFRLGRLYEHEGKQSDAIAEYAQAFRTDPSMRDPKRNPLVIDSELIYRASLENYSRDLATTVEADAVYAEESRFKTVPVDRAVAAEELEPQEPVETAPREVGPAGAAGSVPEGSRPRRPRPPAAGEGGGVVGGPQPHPAAPRINRMNRPTPPPRPTPAPEITPEPEPPAPQQEPGQEQPNPETTPDAPPEDVEPS